jgi:hypothetical protein
VIGAEDDLLGVERARPDVAVDDAERSQHEHRAPRVGDHITVVVGKRLESLASGL